MAAATFDDDGYPIDDPPKRVELKQRFSKSIAQVWPLLSDTDRMNRAIGLPPVAYRDEPVEHGGSRRYGTFKVAGFRLHWLERPYEWVWGHFMRSEREYVSGPLARLHIHWRLTPDGDGCVLEQRLNYATRSWIFNPIAAREIGGTTRRQFRRGYAWIEKYLSAQAGSPFIPRKDEGGASPQALRNIGQRLAEAKVQSPLIEPLARIILETPPLDAVRLRPFAVARNMRLDPKALLVAMLHAARAGLLDVSWDLLCPSCRGDKAKSTSLAELRNEAHCDSCNLTFRAELDRSVELTFRVNESVRGVTVGRYCVGGPQNTPHVIAQLRVPPQATRRISLPLGEGTYLLRSLQSTRRMELRVDPEAPPSAEPAVFDLTPWGDGKLPSVRVPPGPVAVHLVNACTWECLALVERANWLDDACTGAYVSTLQAFRDLFSTEALRPGQELSIRSLTLMFTDLRGSTAMYQRIGDAAAFARVRDHFDILTACVAEHDGAIVKTIGDAVMGAFTRADQAVRAALACHARMQEHARTNPDRAVTLKIGLHTGACFAVNLNDRLDYFGSTVNIAARVEGQCEGGDVVMTQRTMSEPGVQAALDAAGKSGRPMTRALKGIAEELTLYRVSCLANEDGSATPS